MRKRRILGSISRTRKKACSDTERELSSKAELNQHIYEIDQNNRQKGNSVP